MDQVPVSGQFTEIGKPTDDSGNNTVLGSDAHSRVDDLIEQLKQRTLELEAANRELRRVSHYRSLFLARMSHELRTPLTSILGFSEILLEQEQLSEPQRRFCQKIQGSGLQLQNSLDQLVDLSRLEAGQTELFLQELQLPEVIADSCAAVTRMAQKHRVKLECNVSSKATTVVSDKGKLRQIIYNFLAWAISRSKAGPGVGLYADIEASWIGIRIDDSGESIADPEAVFNPSVGPSFQEAGVDELGIIIGRRLVDIMHGSVKLQNRDTGGVSVSIQLPAGPAKG
jgi:signal transduction histidine kinase